MSFAKKELVAGTLWAGVEIGGQQIAQFVISIILARLLDPDEFGLIAMVTIFTYSAFLIIEGGFSGALIQRLNDTSKDKSTVFWYNLACALVMIAALWGLAPAIAHFFDQPVLVRITRWISLGFLFSSLGMVPYAMLQKELRFRERSLSGMVSVVMSGAVSIPMALNGFGAWSLVALAVVTPFVQTLILYMVYPWRPAFKFDVRAFREMFAYGHNLMLSMILRAVFDNIYQVIIGRMYSAAILGYFHRGKRFVSLAADLPTSIISRVCFPALSRVQEDRQSVLKDYAFFLRVTVLFVFPLLAGTAITAPNLITVLVGPKWLPSAQYLQLLCITGMFFPLHIQSYNLLNAMGNARASLISEGAKHAITLMSIACLFRYGIVALLIGEAVSSGISVIIALYYVSRQLKIHLLTPLGWIFPALISSVIVFLVVGRIAPADMSLIALFLKTIVGIVVYGICLFLLREPVFTTALKNGMPGKAS